MGCGNASNILIELSNKSLSKVISTLPLVINNGENRKLNLAINGYKNGLLDNRDLDITIYYKDIDGNIYAVDGSIVLLHKKHEFDCLTNSYGEIRKVRKMPESNVRTRYIDEEF